MRAEYQCAVQKLHGIGNSARTKALHCGYWHDREVMHNGYKCIEQELPCGVVVHVKYWCTG
jgi:hypothetical protein